MSRKPYKAIAALALLLAAVLATPTLGATYTQESTMPIAFTATDPCTGEPAGLSGHVHMGFHLTSDESGGYHTEFLTELQGVTGRGLLTGTQYVAASETDSAENYVFPGFETTFLQTYVFDRVGADGGALPDDLLLHLLFHVTVNNDGTVTVQNFDVRAECR